MSGVGKLLKLAIPCYKFEMPSGKELLIDAFFLNSVKVPARRALLVFPGKAGGGSVGDAVTLNPSYSPEEALRYLVNALDWSIRARYEVSFARFKKFRLSLVFPIAWFRRGENLIKVDEGPLLINDVELNAAISLLKGVLEGVGNSLGRAKYEGLLHVSLTIKGDCEGVREVLSPSQSASRNYNWLLKADEGFREKTNELIRDLLKC